MQRKHAFLKLFNATALSFLLAACATTRQVYLPDEGYAINVSEGERVEIVMHDGKKHSFEVTRAYENGLSGSDGSFAYSEMRSVSVIEKKAGSKNAWWLVLAIAAVAILAKPDDSGNGPLCLYASDDPSRTCL